MRKAVFERKIPQEGHKEKSVPLLGMLTVTCECGATILVVPDVKGMSNAIQAHLKKHEKKEAKRVEDSLIAKIISVTTDYQA